MRANIILIIALLSLPASLLLGQQKFQLISAEMSIAGTSTLHDWVSAVEQLTAKAEIEISDNKLLSIPALEVRVPVKGITSTKGKIMDNKTYSALKAEDHPTIFFKLTNVTLKAANQLTATGQLTIAGKSKKVQFPVDYNLKSNSKIQFTGAYTLKMTDYDVAPPTAVMGTIKTGDEVTINFSCLLEPEGASMKTK